MNVTMVDTDEMPASFAEPDTEFQPTDDAPYRCKVCGTSLTYGGRGRKPVYCDEHKKQASSRTTSNTGSWKALEEAIGDLYRGLAFGVNFIDPISGMAVAGSADALAHSWIVLAQTNKKVEKFLRKLTTGSGVGAVVIAHAIVAIPIMQRHDIIPSFSGRHE